MNNGLAARFPPGFVFGASASDYQIEGAWNEDGKGPGIWDVFCRRPGAVLNGDTGDVACDHYHRWREDVELMARLGLRAYRFAISWPRVLPNGLGPINEAGLDFYDRLVDALLERGITPYATLYHWNLPQALQSRGGWGVRDCVGWFAEYAARVADRLADRVTNWITINEPEVVAFLGHAAGIHAPGLRDTGLALRVVHQLLLAHGLAASALRAAHSGLEVGLSLNLYDCQPASNRPEDVEAARRADGYQNRWYLDPLFGRGYPADMVAWYGTDFPSDHVNEGPALAADLDFLGVNYYSRRVAAAGPEGLLKVVNRLPADATRTAMGWEVYPDGLTSVLIRLHRDYGVRSLLVTENGAAYHDVPNGSEHIDDPDRREYLASHLTASASAIEAGVPLQGYFVWSLLDNFEWALGYSQRFGLVYVDYATRQRVMKTSGLWYRDLIAAAR
jgi:beta-glucosidase